MASDGSGQIPNARSILPLSGSGNPLPPVAKIAATSHFTAAAATATPAATVATVATVATAANSPTASSPAPQALVDQLNKHLNDSGLADQFRLDPAGKVIQQINPATGAVVAELPASEFPALARTVGASGLLLDSLA
jgi:hypothetical protein